MRSDSASLCSIAASSCGSPPLAIGAWSSTTSMPGSTPSPSTPHVPSVSAKANVDAEAYLMRPFVLSSNLSKRWSRQFDLHCLLQGGCQA
jgi:hypothetical protein